MAAACSALCGSIVPAVPSDRRLRSGGGSFQEGWLDDVELSCCVTISGGEVQASILASSSPMHSSPRRSSVHRALPRQPYPTLASAVATMDNIMVATNDIATVRAAADEAMALARAAALAAKEAAALAEGNGFPSSGRRMDRQDTRKPSLLTVPVTQRENVYTSTSLRGDESFRLRLDRIASSSNRVHEEEREVVTTLWQDSKDCRVSGMGRALQVAQEEQLDRELDTAGGEQAIVVPFKKEREEAERVMVRSRRKVERLKRTKKISQEKLAKALLKESKAESPEQQQQQEEQQQLKADYSSASSIDPMRSFMSKNSASKLLTVKEEIELSKGVQDLLQLEKVRDALRDEMGREPSLKDWAEAVGVSQPALDKRIKEGRESMGRMVSCNMRLVVSVAQKYLVRGMNLEDLITEGCMGLIRGVQKFDHRKGFKFSTYAHWWIRQSITRTVAEQTRTIRLPLHLFETVSRVNKARKMLAEELGRAPDNDEVAELVGMSKARMISVMKSIRAPTSMERPLGRDGDGDETLGDMVADMGLPSQEEMIMKKFLRKDIENALHTLSPRERDVMNMRYGLSDGRMKTLEEVGLAFRVTRERIRQIEIKALRKLRTPQRSSSLQHYIADHLS